jgi:hypothetical protein
VVDGLTGLAALHARSRHLTPVHAKSDAPWCFITLCNWRTQAQHLAMSPLPLPDFSSQTSLELLNAMRPYFAEDGITLYEDQPGRWLAQGQAFADLPTASLDRVVGRHVKPWLPLGPQATPLLRLQNEMQMLLYTHPVNDDREARGLPTVNSFWISGTGTAAALDQAQAAPTIVTGLVDAALNENWPAWANAWQAIDTNECQAWLAAQQRGEVVHLTLCGERHAQTWVNQAKTVRQRISCILSPLRIQSLLSQL